ncbi:hypothetical protein [Adhaeribacter radiodurans]|uniref:PepSY domain-containing protein n=1 Tax=Adhaeribacter radiodurans TaxID=2745197 RepID=A0A7L7LBJ7_9BACT|nr:hypothetical protein [Adhaeribacter radiodurans]QMU30201.1 hypothetical protein HUW48_20165 [Adhaeribacter radiodurans]
MVPVSTPFFYLKTAFVSIFFTLIFSLQASAQIAITNDAQLKAETRKSRREAARIKADYKESHLNTSNFTYKKGKSGRKQVDVQEGWESYQFTNNGNVLYTEPGKLKLKHKADRKKKK